MDNKGQSNRHICKEAIGESTITVTPLLLKESKQLLLLVYSGAHEDDIASMKAHRFMQNKSIQLKFLPLTEDAHHVNGAALATIIDKHAHVSVQPTFFYGDYGWTDVDGRLKPVLMMNAHWPEPMANKIACSCTKGCVRDFVHVEGEM